MYVCVYVCMYVCMYVCVPVVCDLNFHKECRDGMVTFINICPRIKLPPEIVSQLYIS